MYNDHITITIFKYDSDFGCYAPQLGTLPKMPLFACQVQKSKGKCKMSHHWVIIYTSSNVREDLFLKTNVSKSVFVVLILSRHAVKKTHSNAEMPQSVASDSILRRRAGRVWVRRVAANLKWFCSGVEAAFIHFIETIKANVD